MLRTPLCDLLGIELPIVAAPMGPSISGPELAAAVSNAGGLGIVSFGANPPPLLRRLVERVRELTDSPAYAAATSAICPKRGDEAEADGRLESRSSSTCAPLVTPQQRPA